MSRVGRLPISIPSGVELKLQGAFLVVKGGKQSLDYTIPAGIALKIANGQAVVEKTENNRSTRALHGLVRTLVANMIIGVSEGFTKSLKITGVGYRAEVKGADLELQLGFSHPILFPIPEGISIDVDKKAGVMSVKGHDKGQVGQVAAKIRGFRPPEPYKGKGVKYETEVIRRKAGKAAASSAG